jgi:hypothetical protein
MTSNDKVIMTAVLSAFRPLLLLALVSGGAAAAWMLAGPPAVTLAGALVADGPRGLDALPFGTALAGLCAGLLLGCAGWLVACTGLVAGAGVARELAPGTRVVGALCRAAEQAGPPVLRRAVAGALGVAVVASLTATAAGARTVTAGTHRPTEDRLAGLPVPDRVTGAARRSADPPPTRGPARPGPPTGMVVRAGQSLWSITADLLPVRSTDAEITRGWHLLHRANAARIGSDPDLILPGTRLVVPDLSAAPHREETP